MPLLSPALREREELLLEKRGGKKITHFFPYRISSLSGDRKVGRGGKERRKDGWWEEEGFVQIVSLLPPPKVNFGGGGGVLSRGLTNPAQPPPP